MKKLYFLGVLLLIVSAPYLANAQIQSLNEMSISPPSFQNEEFNNLSTLLQNSLDYPIASINNGLQGKEVIRFSVSSFGTIEDITVINSVSEEIDREVISVILETSGKWKPGSINGQQTKMTKEIALSYVLYSYDDMLKAANNYMQKGNKLMFLKHNPKKAIKYFNQAYTLFPYEPNVLFVRGICLQKLERLDDANEVWDRLESRAVTTNFNVLPANGELLSLVEPITILPSSN